MTAVELSQSSTLPTWGSQIDRRPYPPHNRTDHDGLLLVNEDRMTRLFRFRRGPASRQRVFAFLERSRRRQRRFKQTIVFSTVLAIGSLFAALPRGRYLAAELGHQVNRLARRGFGIPPDRRDIDEDWRRFRLQRVEDTSRQFRQVFSSIEEPLQKLMIYAGNDPKTGLLRWGNLTQTLLLPSTIFLPDDAGRSYRLRPLTRAVWLRNITIKGIPLTFFLVPDTPALPAAMAGTSAVLVPGSTQTTNSWGLRGPEPDLAAPLRGIVLGDSYMQGLFVPDDMTPAERLGRRLADRLGARVEVLNTGHLGYSPEQEYHTLREYAGRLGPQFVVLSLFANDFGDLFEVLDGKGDYVEGKYWLGEIAQFCRTHQLVLLVVPAPWVNQVDGERRSGFYPGRIANILEHSGMHYLDPIEAFTDAYLRQVEERKREGKPISPDPLFNGHVGDGHFSPLGCEVWARTVAERLVLLLDRDSPAKSP